MRILPGALRHCLFFGDILFVVTRGNQTHADFTLEDMSEFLEGEHSKWSVRGIRDISQQNEMFEEEEPSDEEEEEDEDGEEEESGDATENMLTDDEQQHPSESEDEN